MKTYNLELTPEELVTLVCVLGEIGGDPIRSARKYVDSILNKLPSGYVADDFEAQEKYVDWEVVTVSSSMFIESFEGDQLSAFNEEVLKWS